MSARSLQAALEREHREIDSGIEAFVESLAAGAPRAGELQRAIAALRRHIYLEEELLFPGLAGELAIPTLVMVREHGEIWRTLDALEELAPAGDALSLRECCARLLAQLEAHNGKEEPIFYTRADGGLSAEESDALHAFLAAGHIPDGWVCEALRPGGPPVAQA
ncbi:MAG TPA: hemerythrin domain-containing protein [Solirubrobacteraceae bacterium]|nr:hemerythrin domain-containing protein [Solirubrobacteraceae bacterium]